MFYNILCFVICGSRLSRFIFISFIFFLEPFYFSFVIAAIDLLLNVYLPLEHLECDIYHTHTTLFTINTERKVFTVFVFRISVIHDITNGSLALYQKPAM